MPGLGTIANCGAIVIGSVIGLFLKKGLPEKWQETILSGIALCILIIGIQMALKTQKIIITIFSLAIGAVLGESLDIEGKMNRLGIWVGEMVTKGEGSAAAVAKGFVNASILYCTGAMAIVGSIQDGLANDHATLFAKATLDGLISIILTANLGFGVCLSAISVGFYQGSITMMASAIESFVDSTVLAELTAAGGIMIMAIGTNMLKVSQIRIGNLLPGVFVAVVLAKIFL